MTCASCSAPVLRAHDLDGRRLLIERATDGGLIIAARSPEIGLFVGSYSADEDPEQTDRRYRPHACARAAA